MALNKMRPESVIEIGGKTFRCVMTLDAVARLQTAFGLDNGTWSDLARRLAEQRTADFAPAVLAVLQGNGFLAVEAEELNGLGPFEVLAFLSGLFPQRELPADPAAAAPASGSARGNGQKRPPEKATATSP